MILDRDEVVMSGEAAYDHLADPRPRPVLVVGGQVTTGAITSGVKNCGS
jgi:hypothetical protein